MNAKPSPDIAPGHLAAPLEFATFSSTRNPEFAKALLQRNAKRGRKALPDRAQPLGG
jgi:hypothetical protein